MKPNAANLRWILHRLLVRSRPDLEEVASRSWEICPASTESAPPAIYLDGALERITGFTPWNPPDYELKRVHGGPMEHAATVGYLLENAQIAGPILYCGAFKVLHGFGFERLFADLPRHEVLDAAHLVSNWAGSHFFGPFLRDITVELIPPAGELSVGMVTKTYEHEAGYRGMLALARPPRALNTTVRALTVYSDFGQNRFKQERYRELRARLRAHRTDAAARPTGVYLKRGHTGESRVLVNGDAVEAVLAARGFDIVEPGVLGAEEIVRRCLDAQVIVSVEGSQVSHAAYALADDGAYLVLQPPDRFAMAHKEVADCLDQRFAFEVGTPVEGGFVIETDRLERLLDRLDGAPYHGSA